MRVVVAPDSFGGTLSATAAAEAIAEGWRRTAPDDELRLLPLADGGTGFVEVLHAALGGEWHELEVTGPFGDPVAARWLRIGGYWYPRGGIPIDVFWQTGEAPKNLWLPDQGVAPYRAR